MFFGALILSFCCSLALGSEHEGIEKPKDNLSRRLKDFPNPLPLSFSSNSFFSNDRDLTVNHSDFTKEKSNKSRDESLVDHNRIHVIGPPMTWEEYCTKACLELGIQLLELELGDMDKLDMARKELGKLGLTYAWCWFSGPKKQLPLNESGGILIGRTKGGLDYSAWFQTPFILQDKHFWTVPVYKSGHLKSALPPTSFDIRSAGFISLAVPQDMGLEFEESKNWRRLPVILGIRCPWTSNDELGPILIGDGHEKIKFYGLAERSTGENDKDRQQQHQQTAVPHPGYGIITLEDQVDYTLPPPPTQNHRAQMIVSTRSNNQKPKQLTTKKHFNTKNNDGKITIQDRRELREIMPIESASWSPSSDRSFQRPSIQTGTSLSQSKRLATVKKSPPKLPRSSEEKCQVQVEKLKQDSHKCGQAKDETTISYLSGTRSDPSSTRRKSRRNQRYHDPKFAELCRKVAQIVSDKPITRNSKVKTSPIPLMDEGNSDKEIDEKDYEPGDYWNQMTKQKRKEALMKARLEQQSLTSGDTEIEESENEPKASSALHQQIDPVTQPRYHEVQQGGELIKIIKQPRHIQLTTNLPKLTNAERLQYERIFDKKKRSFNMQKQLDKLSGAPRLHRSQSEISVRNSASMDDVDGLRQTKNTYKKGGDGSKKTNSKKMQSKTNDSPLTGQIVNPMQTT